MKIKLGNDLTVNLETLIDTRLLIQANSGGGKSYAIRKLLEETYGKVQHIILDIEGDFASLRESLDYVLAAKNGDISVNVKSAALLAHKVLELRADIIIDLYEMKQHDRIRFVQLFLDAMTNAPKELWHPCLVVVDEAHIFAPEKSQSESLSAVIDLMTRGRKRGFCGVLATQRLSKLHKDAAAECNNKLIGRTSLDIDLKRAADELGLSASDARPLRTLAPGSFYAYGPAISEIVALKTIGQVKTHHPSAGNRKVMHAPAATAKVKGILSKLTDLPKEAETELKDKASMANKINELTLKIRQLEKQEAKFPTEKFIKATKAEEKKYFERAMNKIISQQKKPLNIAIKNMEKEINKSVNTITNNFIQEIQNGFGVTPDAVSDFRGGADFSGPRKIIVQSGATAAINKLLPIEPGRVQATPDYHEIKLGKCEREILGFLAWRPNADRYYEKAQIGAWIGYSHNSGSFNNALGKLSTAGLIERDSGRIRLASGAHVGDLIEQGSAEKYSLKKTIARLGKCERSIFEFLHEYDETLQGTFFTKEEIGEQTGYSPDSGSFNNALGKLNTMELIRRSNGKVSINTDILNI